MFRIIGSILWSVFVNKGSRKSYQHKHLFNLVHRDDLKMNWAAYELWSFFGLSCIVSYVYWATTAFYSLYCNLPAHPEWVMPIIKTSGALLGLMLLNALVRWLFPNFYFWAVNGFLRPVSFED